MHLFVLDWGAYTHPDIVDVFRRKHISFNQAHYCFKNKYEDEYFSWHFKQFLSQDKYDAVFTVNFFPIIAKLCHELRMPYLAWSYDNPLNIQNPEEYFHYDTNYIFLFDKVQVEGFIRNGCINIFHLPLAINTKRLSSLNFTKEDEQNYGSEISFIGKLYPSAYTELISGLSPYYQGYLNALVRAQSKVIGSYIIDELLTDDLIDSLNQDFQNTGRATKDFSVSRIPLSYAIGTHITREDRISLLALLSRRHHLNLYSDENHPTLAGCHYRGTAGYLNAMPKVFHYSKINLNINLRISQSGMPLRVLDIMGCGGFLLSSFQPELDEYYADGEDIVLYHSIPDAVEKCGYYLSHESVRARIAESGQKKTMENFSYEKQFEKLFRIAGLS